MRETEMLIGCDNYPPLKKLSQKEVFSGGH
jgi:hypothetical protein